MMEDIKNNDKIKTTSLKKNFLLSTIYQILMVLLPFITAPYVSRVLGAELIGTYSFTNSINIYFVLLTALGTASYGLIEISKVRDNNKDRSKVFFNIMLIKIITFSLCLALWLFLIFFYKEFKYEFIILSIPIMTSLFDISWFYLGIEKVKYTVFQNALFKIIGVILIFTLVKTKADFLLYIFILVFSTLCGNLTMFIYLPKFLTKISKKDIDIKYHFKNTIVYFIPTIATSLYTVLDKTLIGAITNDQLENGYYEQATKIITIIKTMVFVSINSLLSSRISYLFTLHKEEEIKDKIKFALNYVLVFGLGSLFGLIGISKPFVPLFFGDGYEKVIYFLMLMAPLIILIGISNLVGALYYNPAGYRKKSSKFLLIGALVNVVLNSIFITFLKGYGAIIASIIAEGLIAFLYIKYSNNFVTFKMIVKLGYKKLISGLIMLGVILPMAFFINNDILAFFLILILGALVYISSLFLLKDEFVISSFKKYILPKLKRKTK